MRLYHGSANIIEAPVFGKGNRHNDYGLGFYCTERLDLAKEWACTENKDGFANEYILETEDLKVLDLSGEEYHFLNWLAILLENRTFAISNELSGRAKEYIHNTFLPDYEGYDVIRGYRADDSYFSFAGAFLNNTISYEQLGHAMRLGKPGGQIVLKSERAFDRLRFVKAEVANNEIFYPRKMTRDRLAREAFRKDKGNPSLDGLYMIDILRNKISNDDPRLR